MTKQTHRESMKKTLVLIMLNIFMFIGIVTAKAEVSLDDISKGKEYIYQFDIENGYSCFDSLIQEYPADPIPYFYKGYLQLLIFSQDMTNEALLSDMKGNFDNCIDLIKEKDNYKKSAHYNYYLGLSSGAVGVYYILDRNYIKGFIHGRRAKNYLEKTVEIDNNYYDAYLGLGVYHYYVGLMSGITKFFAGLFGFSGTTDQGLQEMTLAAEKGNLFRVEAKLAFNLFHYFFRSKMDKPVKVFKELSIRYSKNPLLYMLVGYHYRRTLRPALALPYFKKIDDRYLNTASQVYYMKYFNLTVCYFLLNDFNNSLENLGKMSVHDVNMTMYFKAAVKYYTALNYLGLNKIDSVKTILQKIPDKNHTRYWFLSSRAYVKNSFPPNISNIIKYRNCVLSGRTEKLSSRENFIENAFEKNKNNIWYLYYLDHKGFKYYLTGDYIKADSLLRNIKPYISNYEGSIYLNCWVHLHHARTLIELNRFEDAQKSLETAEDIDDDYMKLVVKREKNKIDAKRQN